MRFKKWNNSFDLKGEDPKALAEQILAREARLDQSWKDDDGRQLRLYVPIADDDVRRIAETTAHQVVNLLQRPRPSRAGCAS